MDNLSCISHMYYLPKVPTTPDGDGVLSFVDPLRPSDTLSHPILHHAHTHSHSRIATTQKRNTFLDENLGASFLFCPPPLVYFLAASALFSSFFSSFLSEADEELEVLEALNFGSNISLIFSNGCPLMSEATLAHPRWRSDLMSM